MITIVADEGSNKIGYELYQRLVSQSTEANYISLENTVVKPCVNCGGCTYKTYGRCVMRDDGDWIYPRIIRSDVLILVTPVVFGSYSFRLKRVLDKFGLFMDRHYFLSNDELVKGGMPDRTFRCFALGITENVTEADAFGKLFRELLIITRGTGRVFISGALLPEQTKDDILREVKA
jgi:hypothetical protein